MDAKELRIGNLVNRLSKLTKITSLTNGTEGFDYVSTTSSGVITGNQIEPILLTEEWLLRFGFKKCDSDTEQGYEFGVYKMFANSLCEFNFCFFDFGDWYQHIKYVHQLQNLYFALTGEELISKN